MPAIRSEAKGLEIERSVAPGGATVVKLRGAINETLSSADLIRNVSGSVLFDVDGVKRVTSYGVREWVNAMTALRGNFIGFVKCRPAMVSQFNMVANFGGSGQMLSFYAPYICPSCSKEIELLVDVRERHEDLRAFRAPPCKCPDCGADAELDDVPESYFSYVASAPLPTPPPEILSILNGDSRPPMPLKIQQDVEGNLTALWLSGPLDKSASFKRLAEGLEGTVLLILDQVTDANEAGLGKLQALLESDGPTSFHLARVPQLIWEQLPGRMGQADLVSWYAPIQCGVCAQKDKAEIRTNGVFESTSLDVCAYCGSGELTTIAKPDASLPMTTQPPPVASYLEAHPKAPLPPGAAMGGGTTVAPNPYPENDSGGMFGRYQIVRQLGLGGMAEVFLSRLTGVGGFKKNLVLKRILPHLSSDQRFITMFLDEARIAARLSHANIVQIFEVGHVLDRYYIAMEYVRGWDLNTIIRVAKGLNRKVPAGIAARILADACAGLHAAHTSVDENGTASPIIHRDVSPHNVLVSNDGQVKLADFGIAKAMDSSSYTPSATVKGKLAYMAPEQLKSESKTDARSDIFAAGLVLFQTLMGEQLFRRENEAATVMAILHEPVPKLASQRPDVPPDLEAALNKALQKSPASRYQTARQFQQDLEAVAAGLGNAATSEALSEWVRELARDAAEAGFVPREMMLGTPTGRAAPELGGPEQEVTGPVAPKS